MAKFWKIFSYVVVFGAGFSTALLSNTGRNKSIKAELITAREEQQRTAEALVISNGIQSGFREANENLEAENSELRKQHAELERIHSGFGEIINRGYDITEDSQGILRQCLEILGDLTDHYNSYQNQIL